MNRVPCILHPIAGSEGHRCIVCIICARNAILPENCEQTNKKQLLASQRRTLPDAPASFSTSSLATTLIAAVRTLHKTRLRSGFSRSRAQVAVKATSLSPGGASQASRLTVCTSRPGTLWSTLKRKSRSADGLNTISTSYYSRVWSWPHRCVLTLKLGDGL